MQDKKRRRALYLALIRSQFEHCSIIWRPDTKSKVLKFEGLQKRALKWILSEEDISYSSLTTYIGKCRQANILPIHARFDLLDLLFFYKVVYKLVPVELPDYLVLYDGNSRLRITHLDYLCYISLMQPKTKNNAFAKGYFYRTYNKWNRLPLDIRECKSLFKFKCKLKKYLWEYVTAEANENDCDLDGAWIDEIE